MKILKIPAPGATRRTFGKEKNRAHRAHEEESEKTDNGAGPPESSVGHKYDTEELSNHVAPLEDTDDTPRSRKRRRIHQAEDLESSYMERLAREEANEAIQRQSVRQVQNGSLKQTEDEDVRRVKPGEDESAVSSEDDDGADPQHEHLAGSDASLRLSKAARTVFLSNVSTAAIKSKSAKKVLLAHLSSSLPAVQKNDPPLRVESLRFRSTAFVSGVGPKKAAFAKKELMEDTTANTNAYVVYSSETAARVAASKLNGTVVLDRHLRADYAAQPSVINHRRCIFVGNLSFVDKESLENPNGGEDIKPKRSKAKEPADAEEGLWRTFGRAGAIESVRVVRDKETRVGKGFAYVQFRDENGVEAALLYNDKKFPPMLPRKLRVMRAKRPKQAIVKRASFTDSMNSKANDRSGKFGSRGNKAIRSRSRLLSEGGQAGPRRSNNFIFEGHRASSSGGSESVRVKNKKRRAMKPNTRSSRRGTDFKAAGGKRKRG